MTKNYLKKFVILVAVIMHMPTISAMPENVIPVCLYRKHIPVINGTMKPSKAPVHQDVPIYISYDADNCLLFFESAENLVVSYYIYNEAGSILESETYAGNSHEVSLYNLCCGQYTIVVEVNNIAYQGVFVVE